MASPYFARNIPTSFINFPLTTPRAVEIIITSVIIPKISEQRVTSKTSLSNFSYPSGKSRGKCTANEIFTFRWSEGWKENTKFQIQYAHEDEFSIFIDSNFNEPLRISANICKHLRVPDQSVKRCCINSFSFQRQTATFREYPFFYLQRRKLNW